MNASKCITATITAIVLTITVVWMLFPLLSGNNLPGFGGDPFFCTYIISSIIDKFGQGLTPFHFNFWDIPMFYPNQGVLGFSDPFILQALLVGALQYLFSLDIYQGVTIIHVSFLFLNWFCGTLFLRSLAPSENTTSIILGWIWAFGNQILSQSAHLQNTPLFVFPMALAFAWKLSNENSKTLRNTLGLAGAFFLSSLSNLYYLVFLAYFIPLFWIIISVWSKKKSWILHFARIVPAIVLALLLSFPVLYHFSRIQDQYPEFSGQRPIELTESSRLLDYFSGNLMSPMYRKVIPYNKEFERSQVSSPLTQILILSSLIVVFSFFIKNSGEIRYSQSAKIFFSGLAIFGASVFFGSGLIWFPEVYKILIEYFPGIGKIRSIGRIGMVGSLGGILILYSTYIQLRQKFLLSHHSYKNKFLQGMILLLGGFMIVERILPDFRNWKIDVSEVSFQSTILAQELNRIGKENSVLEINLDANGGDLLSPLIHAIHHHQPVVSGFSGFYPYSHRNFFQLKDYITNSVAYNSEIEVFFDWAKIVILSGREAGRIEFRSFLVNRGFKEKPPLFHYRVFQKKID